MTDALLELSSRLEHIQNDLRMLASLPDYMRARNNPIALPEAETMVNRLAVLVTLWTQPPRQERRHQPERRRADRRHSADGENGAVA